MARRGSEMSWKARFQSASGRLSGVMPATIVLLLLVIGSGGWFYYNAHRLNAFQTAKQRRQLQADYEKLYKKYEKQPLPKIIAVDTTVNIYPQRRSFSATGWYILKNNTDQPISDIHVTGQRDSIDEIHFDRSAQVVLDDKNHWYSIYHLAQPLAPGDKMRMDFRCSYTSHGFKDGGERAEFAYNGTFFDSDYFPYLGYNRNVELDNPVRRREEKLGPLRRVGATRRSLLFAAQPLPSRLRLDQLSHRSQHQQRPDRHRSRLSATPLDARRAQLLRVQHGFHRD